MPEFDIIPAVDIRDGRCVRLYQGLPGEETVFDEDPLNAALRWEGEGARRLHVVDLDGAFEGSPMNRDIIEDIAGRLSIPVQVGGGIRTTADARSYIDSGVSRVIIGTAAFMDSDWLEEIVVELGDRLAVGVDVKGGRVAVSGWTGDCGVTPREAVEGLEAAGVRRIIHTSVSKDGTLSGPDFEGIEKLAGASAIPLIASGGVGSVEDVARIRKMSDLGVEGLIVGMALYRGLFTLADAQRAIGKGGC